MNDIYVFDIDGTLADNQHRVHYLEGDKKDWDGFFGAQEHDTVNYGTVQILDALVAQDHPIILLTGRGEELREGTVQWLAENEIDYDVLIMRPEGNREGDDVLKIRQLEEYVNKWGGVVRCIFDDRKRVVQAFRKKGYLVHHVAEGDF